MEASRGGSNRKGSGRAVITIVAAGVAAAAPRVARCKWQSAQCCNAGAGVEAWIPNAECEGPKPASPHAGSSPIPTWLAPRGHNATKANRVTHANIRLGWTVTTTHTLVARFYRRQGMGAQRVDI